MRIVKIIYNPYSECTRLLIDDIERKGNDNRFEAAIVGKPMKSWVSPYFESYRRWEGILPELMDELNDDELDIYFYGISGQFDFLKNELQKQALLVEEKGYSSSAWSIQMKQRYRPERVQESVLRFVQGKKVYAPDQHSLIAFECIEESMKDNHSMGIRELADIRREILRAVRIAADYCRNKRPERNMDVKVRFWENAVKELEYAYEGGGKS